MDQSLFLGQADRKRASERLSQFVASSVQAGRASETPFHHLVFDRIFPDDVYNAMLTAMPVAADYRPMSGRSKAHDLQDGTHTRVKIDLFPEYIRSLPPEKRVVWDVVGRALCSAALKEALVRRLAPRPRRRLPPGLGRRFGADFAKLRLYPVPILTRDIPGYRIYPHPDTHWKGITVQLYLPRDDTTSHVGTIFHARQPDGSLPKHTQMKFVPNSGYAFAVDEDTWHSADPVGAEVTTRDSILLTYFDDAGVLRFMRNRGKRVGNWLLNEFRSGLRR